MLLCMFALTSCQGKTWSKTDEMAQVFLEQEREKVKENKLNLKENPEDVDSMFKVAYAYEQMEVWGKAKKWYEKLLKIDPENFKAHGNLAQIYENEGRFEMAAQHIREYYVSAPLNMEGVRDTVRILIKAAEYDQAQEALEYYATNSDQTDESQIIFISELYESIAQARNN